jgi:hypothetical protein
LYNNSFVILEIPKRLTAFPDSRRILRTAHARQLDQTSLTRKKQKQRSRQANFFSHILVYKRPRRF